LLTSHLHVKTPSQELTTTFLTSSSGKSALTRTYHYFSHLFFRQERPHRNLPLLFSPLLHVRAPSQELITTFLTSSSRKSALTRTYHYFSHLFFTQQHSHKNSSLLFPPLLHARAPSQELTTTFLTTSSRKNTLTGTHHRSSHLFLTRETNRIYPRALSPFPPPQNLVYNTLIIQKGLRITKEKSITVKINGQKTNKE